MQIHLANSAPVLQHMDEALQCLEQASSDSERSQLQEANHLSDLHISAQVYQLALKNVSVEEQAAIINRFFGEFEQVINELETCIEQLAGDSQDAAKLKAYSLCLLAAVRFQVASDRDQSAN